MPAPKLAAMTQDSDLLGATWKDVLAGSDSGGDRRHCTSL
jgi:hypothetical protein